jgi:hypothetical protein
MSQLFRMLVFIALPFLGSLKASAEPKFSVQILYSQACCKVCRAGQACGDSCISWTKRCHKGPGCACQGVQLRETGKDGEDPFSPEVLASALGHETLIK